MSRSNQRARGHQTSAARPPAAAVAPPTPAPQFSGGEQPSRLLSMLTSGERKNFPVTTGFIDYFPDAVAAVAEISFKGNQKHNPGQPLHWARGKSMDHADCIGRHLIERGSFDAEGSRHSAQLAWRALALLQEELELEKSLSNPRGATPLPPR